jgi:alanine racemase
VKGNLRPSHIEIDLRALRSNLSVVKGWAGANSKLMAVVKANAYGHGAVRVSEVLSEEKVDFLGVAFIEEAIELKDAGIKTPIVLLYPETDERSAEAVRNGFNITITDLDQYDAIKKIVGNEYPINYFVKLETGMNRYGMSPDEVEAAAETKDNRPGSHLVGITTNLADSNGNNSLLAKKQVGNFMHVMESIQRLSQNGLLYSLESSGILWKNKKTDGSLVRVGHLLYGLVPGGAASPELQPVMSVKSRVAEIHNLKAGDGVGYGFSFVASKEAQVATIPMGYADGYPWALSNKGSVVIKGKKAPVVGRICMDAFMIDITDIPGCQEGDEVVILGQMENEKIDAHELGQWSGSFSYEILSRWSRRLPRIYL